MNIDTSKVPLPFCRSWTPAKLYDLPIRTNLCAVSNCAASNTPPLFPIQGMTKPNVELNGYRLVALLNALRQIEPGTSKVQYALNSAIKLTVQALHSGLTGGVSCYVQEAISLLRASSSSQCRQAALQLEAAFSPINGGASAEHHGVRALAGRICASLLNLKYVLAPDSHPASSPEARIIGTIDTLVHRLTELDSKDHIQNLLRDFVELLNAGDTPSSNARTRLEHEICVAMADCRTFNVARAGARAQESSMHQAPSMHHHLIVGELRCRDIEEEEMKALTRRKDPNFSIRSVESPPGAMMKVIAPPHAATWDPADSHVRAKVPKLSEGHPGVWGDAQAHVHHGSTSKGDHTV